MKAAARLLDRTPRGGEASERAIAAAGGRSAVPRVAAAVARRSRAA